MNIDWPLMYNVIRRNSVRNTFGMVRLNADGTPRPHQGWDFFANIGTEAYAIANGKVIFVAKNLGDYGTQLCLGFQFQGVDLYAFYAHLKNIYVCEGQPVVLGQTICTTGDSGNAKGLPNADEHLHLEIRTQAYCGKGLTNRLSPIEVFGKCPLTAAAERRLLMSIAK